MAKRKAVKPLNKCSVLLGGYKSKSDAIAELLRVDKKNFKATLSVRSNLFYLDFGTYADNEAANECAYKIAQAGFDKVKVVEI